MRRRTEVNPSRGQIKFTSPGESVVGKYLGFKEYPKRLAEYIADKATDGREPVLDSPVIELEDGREMHLPGSMLLRDKFEGIPPETWVEVQYVGEIEGTGVGANQAKDWRVWVLDYDGEEG